MALVEPTYRKHCLILYQCGKQFQKKRQVVVTNGTMKNETESMKSKVSRSAKLTDS